MKRRRLVAALALLVLLVTGANLLMANLLSPITTDLDYPAAYGLARLKARLVAAGLVRLNTDAASVSAPGDSITIPNVHVEGAPHSRAIGGAATANDISTFTRQLVLGQKYAGVKIDNLQRQFSSIPLQEALIDQLVTMVAQQIDSDICGLWNYMPYETGETDGTAFANSTDKVMHVNGARKILVDNYAPLDELHLIVNSQEAFNLSELDLLRLSQNAGDATVLKTGSLGQIRGFNVWESQQIQTATLSTTTNWGTPLINNAPGYGIGVESIAVDGLQASGTIKAGSSFALGSYRYVVTADVTAAAGAATLAICPQLKQAVVDGQALTPTAHSAAGSVNLAFHPDAILLVNRPMAPMGGGVDSAVRTDDQTGLSIRLSVKANLFGDAGTAFAHEIVLDILAGAVVQRPELVVRIFGQA